MKRLLANVGLLVVSLTVSFLVLEAVLRFLDPPFFTDDLHYHPELGWVGRPGSVSYPGRGGKLVRVELNDLGFRDADQSADAVDGVRRIVVVGDSFTEAAQVELHETYWSVLKRMLNASAAPRPDQEGREYWEVVSLGMGAYGTTQELLALERIGMRYRPEVVILQVFAYNDVLNNSLSAAYVLNPHDTYRPYLDPQTDYRTITWIDPATSWLRRKSAAFRFGFLLANRRLGAWGDEKFFADTDAQVADVARRFEMPDVPEVSLKRALMLNGLAPPDHHLDIVREGWAATDAAMAADASVRRPGR